jgi:Complex 1 protein (LYR family)
MRMLLSAWHGTDDADDDIGHLTDVSDLTQRQVLAFYRTVVRQTRKQPAAQRAPIAAYARGEFERHVSLLRASSKPNSYFMAHDSSPCQYVFCLLPRRHRDVNPKDYQLIEVRTPHCISALALHLSSEGHMLIAV